MNEKKDRYTRRDFLQYVAWIATLGTMGGVTAGSARFMFPNVLYEPSKFYKIGKPLDYPEGITLLPDKRIYVVHYKEKYKVMSGVCSHLGCTPNWVEKKKRFECPCHGSIFDEKGVVVSGPAPSPLLWYQVSLATDGKLMVDERRVVSFSEALMV